jgi:D-threo-aldose 1-dehydrogenase
MRTTHLGDTGIETSVLGFGCAGLFREPSSARRQRLLEAAFEAGICHFDVAPMYGLGLAEPELGRFARRRRERIVLATKFGIAPTAAASALARVQQPVQRVLDAIPTVREHARPTTADPRAGLVGATLYRSSYDAVAARVSLERSLRALQTDHVDLLFVHDPRPGDLQSDDLRGYLESARAAGHIRAWGVAGEPQPSVAAAQRLGAPVPVLQLRGDVFLRTLAQLPPKISRATILFGVVAHALRRILALVRADDRECRRWSEAVGVNCGNSEQLASLLLRDALRENPGGAVLFSTVRPDRLVTAAAAAGEARPNDVSLDAFRALVAEQATAPEAPS